MREADSVLETIVTAAADRSAVESIPSTLETLEQVSLMLKYRSLGLAMLSPREASRPARLLDAVQVVAELIREPGRVEEVRPEDVGAILMVIAGLETALAARLMVGGPSTRTEDRPVVEDDRLLTAAEAGALLRVTPRWLYRRAGRLPFARRLSRKAVRFSEAGIRRWMAAKRPS
jgi:predicted DNA-binding transcriptional regulator AlpA